MSVKEIYDIKITNNDMDIIEQNLISALPDVTVINNNNRTFLIKSDNIKNHDIDFSEYNIFNKPISDSICTNIKASFLYDILHISSNACILRF